MSEEGLFEKFLKYFYLMCRELWYNRTIDKTDITWEDEAHDENPDSETCKLYN